MANRNAITEAVTVFEYANGWKLKRERRGAAIIWHTFQEDADGRTVTGSRIEHPTRRAGLDRLVQMEVM